MLGGEKFNIWKTGRNDMKGLMSHWAFVKLRYARSMSFRKYFSSVTGMKMLILSHLEVHVRISRTGPRRE